MRKQRKRHKKKRSLTISILLILIIAIGGIYVVYDMKQKEIETEHKNHIAQIQKHYNKFVITNKLTSLYEKENDKYVPTSKIQKDEMLTLEEKEDFTYTDEYFKVTTFDKEYFVNYKDIDKLDNPVEYTSRYKNYIPFNKNIITIENAKLYDENDDLIYQFKDKLDLPIIINKKDHYGVEYNGRLLYIKDEDIEDIYEHENTDKSNTKSIAVLNYHFFYTDDDNECNQIICLSTSKLETHLKYIKDNNIFTPTMKELEMYIDGIVQLPKSIVLTIDDGWRAKIGTEVISEYKLNATLFLMSAYYNPNNYQNEYIEVHSHGHDIHNPGICPGGQGGAIKCLEKTKLLEDLKQSREELNNTTVFCYPFYEYNDYSISVLKEAGYTMAFGGVNEDGKPRVVVGSNKFKLPRYVIYNTTTANDIKRYIG